MKDNYVLIHILVLVVWIRSLHTATHRNRIPEETLVGREDQKQHLGTGKRGKAEWNLTDLICHFNKNVQKSYSNAQQKC